MTGPIITNFGRDLLELDEYENLNPGGLTGDEVMALFSPVGQAGRRVIGSITSQRFAEMVLAVIVFDDIQVEDDPYDASSWNGSLFVPTKNAVRDKIEAVIAAATAAYQPLDADLTAIAAISTTAFGRAFLALADAAAARTAIGLVLGTDIYSKAAIDSGFQPLDSDLTAIAALTTTSFGRAFLALADIAAAFTALSITANGKALVQATDYAAMRALLDLEAGTDFYSKTAADAAFQALDSDLTAFAALSPSNDDIAQRKAGAWTNRTPAQLLADLAAVGSTFQPLDSDLTSWAAITRASGFDAFVASPTSVNLKAAITDETGSGALVFATSPTLVTPVLGAASATSMAFSSTSGIIGTTTNDSAAAGSVGELIPGAIASGAAVSLTSPTAKSLVSILLTPGDWDVNGVVYFIGNAATSVTLLRASVSITDNTMNTTVGEFDSQPMPATVLGAVDIALKIPLLRVSIAAPTTLYLVAAATFSVNTMAAYGKIRARRVR